MLVISRGFKLNVQPSILLVLLPIALLASLLPTLLNPSIETGIVVLLSLLLLILLIIPLLYRTVKGELDIFEPITIFGLMFAIGYPLRALSIIYLEDLQLTLRPLGEQGTIYYLTLALLYAIIGLVAFYSGYSTGFGKAIGKKLFIVGDQWSAVRTRRIIILFSISGLFFYFLLMEMAGGAVHFITHMAHRVELVAAGGGYVHWGATLMPLASIIWYIRYLTEKKSKLFWAHFAASSLILTSLGGRSGVILFWIVLLVLHHYLGKKINLWKMFALIVVFLVFSLGMLGFRLATVGGFQAEQFRATLAETLSLQGLARTAAVDFNIIDRFILIMGGVESGELDLKFGSTIFIDPWLMPIPRTMWPDKPTTLDGLIVRTFFPGWGGIGGIPPSLLGELYLNFLLPGIILGMFLFGLGCKVLRSYLDFNRNNKGVIAVYAVSITSVLGLTLSGNFTLAVIHYLTQMMPLSLAIVHVSGNRILVRR
jgi:oligosaccharide repeat unit polymerase